MEFEAQAGFFIIITHISMITIKKCYRTFTTSKATHKNQQDYGMEGIEVPSNQETEEDPFSSLYRCNNRRILRIIGQTYQISSLKAGESCRQLSGLLERAIGAA